MKPNSKYKTIFYIIVITLFIGTTLPVKSQEKSHNPSKKGSIPQKLTVKSMQSDMAILWSAIKEMHPGYNYYTSADSLQKAYNQTYSSINKPLYESEFISQIYPFICKLRCGHTQIKHSVGHKDPVGLYPAHLPFKVLATNGRVFITTHQTEVLRTGDEIISINDVVVKEIIKQGFDLYSTDGYNQTFKELFLSEYDGFEDACNKYYHWKGSYKMQIRTRQGELKDLTVDTDKIISNEPQTAPFDNYTNWTTAEKTGNLKLRFFNDSQTAYFETKPFSYEDTLTYKEAFKQIQDKKIKNLILDMRHNTGGDIRVAIQLLSYLADSPFNIIKDVRSRLQNPALNKSANYFDKDRTNGFLQGYKITNKEGLWYHVETTPAMGTVYGPLPLAKEYHFDGSLYVLIDGATFSSGALFTAALKSQCKKVKFIGRETAGGEEGCNGMVMQELTLPNTKIMIDFPWMRVESVARNPIRGRGIMPDYRVDYDPLDIVIKKDRDLEKAMELIK
ncbi:C-terminal processing protease CtpA/Prc [Flavobacterium sp. 28YEA47A]|uniref:S41 family peptidase n=1 Tax=Flavobacterium sp. 28YEA47A TaxID=3156276 RepID=UPI003513F696